LILLVMMTDCEYDDTDDYANCVDYDNDEEEDVNGDSYIACD